MKIKIPKLFTISKLFLFIVVIPTFLTSFYLLFIATPIYISESKIIIKSSAPSPSFTGLSSLLKSVGVLEPSIVGSYFVMNYIHSRDAMFELDKKYQIKKYYESSKLDFLQRFDPLRIDPSYENFSEYYKDKVVTSFLDPTSSILTIRVRAADKEYAYNLAKELVKMSERFVNALNARSSYTALEYYKQQLEDSRKKVKKLGSNIAQFLTKTGVVSPEQQIGAVLQSTIRLQEQLIGKQIELLGIISVAPENPKIPILKEEIRQLKTEIDKNLNFLAGAKDSIAPHAVELELLKTELQMLQKEVEANFAAYLQAQNQAFMQQLFIEKIEEPFVPDAPMEPERLKIIFTVFAISFALWGILSILIAGIKEHREV
ncbi:MAG TPA: hypothetical protein DIT22_05570 [Thermodesulfobacterium commune]|nr:MAG: Capsule polysaccharide export protein [Desulfonauticus sp. 38_4375]HCP10156.1 hypothetical protein [Thermodesulfobacterium commune]